MRGKNPFDSVLSASLITSAPLRNTRSCPLQWQPKMYDSPSQRVIARKITECMEIAQYPIDPKSSPWTIAHYPNLNGKENHVLCLLSEFSVAHASSWEPWMRSRPQMWTFSLSGKMRK